MTAATVVKKRSVLQNIKCDVKVQTVMAVCYGPFFTGLIIFGRDTGTVNAMTLSIMTLSITTLHIIGYM